jgi:hypothetical protein
MPPADTPDQFPYSDSGPVPTAMRYMHTEGSAAGRQEEIKTNSTSSLLYTPPSLASSLPAGHWPQHQQWPVYGTSNPSRQYCIPATTSQPSIPSANHMPFQPPPSRASPSPPDDLSYSTGSPSSNSLLAKRRGETIADQMESGLHFSANPRSASYRKASAGTRTGGNPRGAKEDQPRGRGRDYMASNGNSHLSPVPARVHSVAQDEESPRTGVGSKLTPTRRGPDLFLSVDF